MSTLAVVKTFPELLEQARVYLALALQESESGEASAVGDISPSGMGLGVDEQGRVRMASEEGREVCEALYWVGASHGLTVREITAILLRPLMRLLRPTARSSGCGCPRCSPQQPGI